MTDMNDNPPKFEVPSYSCMLSEDAERGQFVTMVTASDADTVDQGHLTYSIVGGNDLQTFSMQPSSGKCFSFLPYQVYREICFSVKTNFHNFPNIYRHHQTGQPASASIP